MKKLWYLLSSFIFCLAWGHLDALLCCRNPTCYCSGKQKTSIYCRDVRNVSDIEGLLKNTVSAYRLRIIGSFISLPSRAFEGFSVTMLVIIAPLEETIPDDSLSGILNLQILNFNSTHFISIPRVLANKNFRTLQLVNGLLAGIETELQNMTDTKEILLNNNEIAFLNPTAFYGSHDVEKLDLSYNKLTYLHPETFVPLKNLRDINLMKNQLYTVADCFLTFNPQIINLYGNNLTNVDRAFHRGMWTMKSLDLGGNPHLQLSGSTFNGTMKSLSQLLLSDNGFSSLDPYVLQHFPTLFSLFLNRNNLSSISKDLFRFSRFLNRLEMSDNHLKSAEGLFEGSVNSWKVVKLDGNDLMSIRLNDSFQTVTDLDLSRNQINSIKKEDINFLKSVKNFDISSNNINELEFGCFSDLTSLVYLDLSSNPLKSLNGSVRNLTNLQLLFLRSSELESLSEEELSETDFLTRINLRNNSLRSLYGVFRKSWNLKYMDVAMNNLTTLTADTFPPSKRSSIRLKGIWMADNPWSCDCRLAWIVNWLKKKGTVLKDEPICSAPAHLQGSIIRQLNHTYFMSWVDDCPTPCKCQCQAHGESVGVEVNCVHERLTQVPGVFPMNTWSLNVRGNFLQSFDVLNLDDLQSLNLENNEIAKIQFKHPNNITCLRLAGNELRTFPLDKWDNTTSLDKVTLSQNPWTCNCDTWNFRNWLIKHNDSVLDLLEVRCGPDESFFLRNKPIIKLSRKDLCTVFPVYAVVIISVSSVLFVLCIACYCLRKSLFPWLYSCGCTCLKGNTQHEESYDAFLMYSHHDEEIATEVSKGLEDIYHLSLCISNRDVPLPRTPEKIAAFVMHCHKVIVLLTRKFLDDYEQMHLLKSAMSFSVDSSSQYFIFITHDLQTATAFDPILTAVMKSSTCLRWGERLFWPKLIYQLPNRKVNNSEGDAENESFLRVTPS